jgi:hypothetical protein
MGKCYGRLIRLPHTKVLVWRDISGREVLISYLVKIFRACLATEYVPAV